LDEIHTAIRDVIRAMPPMPGQVEPRIKRLSRNDCKAVVRDRIRALLFDDYPICSIPKAHLMAHLAQLTMQQRLFPPLTLFEQTLLETYPGRFQPPPLPPPYLFPNSSLHQPMLGQPPAPPSLQQQQQPYSSNFSSSFPNPAAAVFATGNAASTTSGQLSAATPQFLLGDGGNNASSTTTATMAAMADDNPLSAFLGPSTTSRTLAPKSPVTTTASAAKRVRTETVQQHQQQQQQQYYQQMQEQLRQQRQELQQRMQQLQPHQPNHYHQQTQQPPAIFVKPESAMGDPDATPKDHDELSVCAQLQQNCGFTDSYEMLSSYRRLKTANYVPTVDDVMIDIITAREEASEAQKMDEARRQSEQSRKEEAKKRRDQIQHDRQVKLESATFADLGQLYFPHSWILHGTAAGRLQYSITACGSTTPLKQALSQLLELELKARKWYGPTLPAAYFRRVLSAELFLAGHDDNDDSTSTALADTLADRVNYLQHVMYQLSAQTKSGVPKAFRDAYDADNTTGLDDDDVVLQPPDDAIHIIASAAKPAVVVTTTTRAAANNKTNNKATAAAMVVIDLVD
jgi:hypothetical protein